MWTFVQALPYVPNHNVSRTSGKFRVVTAAGLFGGHDAAVNIPA